MPSDVVHAPDGAPAQAGFDPALWKAGKLFELCLPGFLASLGPGCAKVDPGPPAEGFPASELHQVRSARRALDTDSARRQRILQQDEAFPEFLQYVGLSWAIAAARFPSLHAASFTVPIVATRPVLMVLKDKYNVARPVELAPDLNPVIDNPGHPAYPSGHTCQTRLSVLLLMEILPARLLSQATAKGMRDLAEDVAVNREHAGVHYPSDTVAGRKLADTCLPYLLASFRVLVDNAKREASRI